MPRLSLPAPCLAVGLLIAAVTGCAAAINGTTTAHDGNTYPYILLSQLPPGSAPRSDQLLSGLWRRVWVDGDTSFRNNSVLITNRYENTNLPGDVFVDHDAGWAIFEIEDVASYAGVPSGDGYVRISFEGAVLKSWYKSSGTYEPYQTGTVPDGNTELIARSGPSEFLSVRTGSSAGRAGWFHKLYVFKWSEDPAGTGSDLRIIYFENSSNYHLVKSSPILKSNGQLVVLSLRWNNSYNLEVKYFDISGDTVTLSNAIWVENKSHSQRWGDYALFENSNGTETIAPSAESGLRNYGWPQIGSYDGYICEGDQTRTAPTEDAYYGRCQAFGSFGEDSLANIARDMGNKTLYVAMEVAMDADLAGPLQYYDHDAAIFAADYHSFKPKWKTVFGKTASGNMRIGHMVPSESYLYFVLDGSFIQYPLCEPGYQTGWDMSKNEHVYCMPCNNGKQFAGQNLCGPCPVGTSSPNNASLSFSSCLPCQAGYYADVEGLSECKACSPGYFSAMGQETCIDCPRGTFSSSPASTICEICAANFYGNDTAMTECHACPGGAVSPRGSGAVASCKCNTGYFGDIGKGQPCRACPDITVATCQHGAVAPSYLAGFWAQEDDPYKVFQCIPKAACPGGAGYEICSDGYTGQACNTCDSGYYRSDGQCLKCSGGDNASLVIMGIVALVLLIVVPLLLVFFCIYAKMHNHPYIMIIVRTLRRVWMSMGKLARFMQVLSVVLKSNVAWPALFGVLLSIASVFSISLESLRFGCTMSGSEVTSLVYHLKLILPAVIYGALTILAGGLHLCNYAIKSPRITGIVTFIIRAILLSITFLYLFLSSTASGIFGCFSNGAGGYMWQHSAEVDCFVTDGVWITMVPVGLVGIAIYSIGIPLVWLGLTLFFYKRRGNALINSRFEVLWRQYDPWAYWWESLNFMYRFLVSSSSILMIIGTMDQLLFLAMISVLYVSFFYLFKPLKDPREDILEGIIHITLVVTIILGLVTELKYINSALMTALVVLVLTMYPVIFLVASVLIVEPLMDCCKKSTHRHRSKGTVVSPDRPEPGQEDSPFGHPDTPEGS